MGLGMRYILTSAAIFLILSTAILARQDNQITVSGKVVNEETGAPLENVNIFLSNTTIGTTTAKNGEFIITNIPYGTYDIIFSCVGYQTEKQSFSSYQPAILNFNVTLKMKMINLSPVNVTGSIPKDWKENLNIFTKLFIGETINAEDTKILNPEVLYFVKDDKTNSFKAYADSVIKVQNDALGYLLYVVLDSLEYNPRKNSLMFICYPRFEELPAASEDQKRTWENNRQKAFLDSPKHFYYDLVHHLLDKDYFILHETTGEGVFSEDLDISCDSDSTVYNFNYIGGLVIQRSLNNLPDILHFRYPSVRIDKYGNLLTSYYAVATYGEWSQLRIADLLPLNYVYQEE